MQSKDITAGEAYVVEFPRDEADMEFGRSKALVKATIVEVGVEFDMMRGFGGRPSMKKGVLARLDEPVRVIAGDGFSELPVGHEFHAESRLVERLWGSYSGRRDDADEDRLAARARRYREQDELRELFERFGLPPAGRITDANASGYTLKGGEVRIGRTVLLSMLRRLDPMDIAGQAVGLFVEAVEREQPWTGLADAEADEKARWKAAALDEIRAGLRVTDREVSLCGLPSEKDDGRPCTLFAGHEDPEHQATF